MSARSAHNDPRFSEAPGYFCSFASDTIIVVRNGEIVSVLIECMSINGSPVWSGDRVKIRVTSLRPITDNREDTKTVGDERENAARGHVERQATRTWPLS